MNGQHCSRNKSRNCDLSKLKMITVFAYIFRTFERHSLMQTCCGHCGKKKAAMSDSTEREASPYLDCQKPRQWRRFIYPARPLLSCWMSLGQIWCQSQNMEKLLAMLHFLEHSSTIAVSVSQWSVSGLSPR